jgi:hypothetical protein
MITDLQFRTAARMVIVEPVETASKQASRTPVKMMIATLIPGIETRYGRTTTNRIRIWTYATAALTDITKKQVSARYSRKATSLLLNILTWH